MQSGCWWTIESLANQQVTYTFLQKPAKNRKRCLWILAKWHQTRPFCSMLNKQFTAKVMHYVGPVSLFQSFFYSNSKSSLKPSLKLRSKRQHVRYGQNSKATTKIHRGQHITQETDHCCSLLSPAAITVSWLAQSWNIITSDLVKWRFISNKPVMIGERQNVLMSFISLILSLKEDCFLWWNITVKLVFVRLKRNTWSQTAVLGYSNDIVWRQLAFQVEMTIWLDIGKHKRTSGYMFVLVILITKTNKKSPYE